MTPRPAAPERNRQAGQILPLFALSLLVILAIGALVLDGANMLVTRRHLQNAGDAAALAGANIIQKTGQGSVCSATAGPPPGSPRSDIVTAVTNSLTANYPGLVAGNISVSCPAGWDNSAVQVDLHVTSATYLGGAIGLGARNVATTSIAVNGQIAGSNYSVVLLDPSNSSWPNGRKGCPAMLISGGPTVIFDGSVMIDSACTAANGGALAANGSSATVTMASGKAINMVGTYNLGPLTISPAPVTGATSIPDPLITLDAIGASSTFTTRNGTAASPSKLVLNNTTQVLQPGVYYGGIQLKNSSIALLRPGVYILDGGGLDIGAQASFCSISTTSTATTCAGFATGDCPDATCGVLILNRGTASGTSKMEQITVGAGSTLKLKAYDERAITGGDYQYRNMLIWQESTPAASSSYAQPILALNGGGTVDISGTVYAPQGAVTMGGGSGGSGGGTNLTVQFISFDFTISGNSSFHFYYSDADFARPKDYGLVK
jgi:hypothetical protein